ncbi:MAG: DEAD/DEAH box helicase [Alphaproteobacteria bacterium]|nr:DEAD/DEAH box helicase [Alphaproteobacteria bacterium]
MIPKKNYTIDPEYYSIGNIRKWIDGVYYERGVRYAENGNVLAASVDSSGTMIAQVEGSGGRVYDQTIRFLDKGSIDGDCSCPVGWNCKHVAAALVHLSKTSPGPAPGLSLGVERWLEDIGRVAGQEKKGEAKTPEREFLYLLDFDEETERVLLTPGSTTVLKSGRRKFKEYRLRNAINGTPPKFLQTDDLLILRRMASLPEFFSVNSYGRDHSVSILGSEGAAVLGELARSGKLYWKTPDGPVLGEGPARPGAFGWVLSQDGTQRLQPKLREETCDALLPTVPPCYVDASGGIVGKVDMSLPDGLVERLLKSPSLSPDEAPVVAERMEKISPDFALPAPTALPRRTRTVEPVPCLRLIGEEIRYTSYYGYGGGGYSSGGTLAIAEMAFDYGGTVAPYSKDGGALRFVEDGTLNETPRNASLEDKCVKKLRECGLSCTMGYRGHWSNIRTAAHRFVMDDDNGRQYDQMSIVAGWLDFLTEDAPRLRKEGWRVEIDESFPLRAVEPDDEWDARIEEGSGVDWFDFSLSVTADGKTYDLLPILAGIVRQMDRRFFEGMLEYGPAEGNVPVATGEPGVFLSLPAARVRMIVRFLRDLWDGGRLEEFDGGVRLLRTEAAMLADLEAMAADEAARMRWHSGERIRELGKKMRDFKGISPVAPPLALKAELRPYQQEGLNWLAFLREYGLSGILADDMGLGKTVQALAWLAHEKTRQEGAGKPSLVVAPTSLMHNWCAEAEKFLPDMKVLMLHGADRKERFEDIAGYDLVLTTYPLLTRDKDVLLDHDFFAVILDEAQFIKNSKARMTQIVRQLRAEQRLCLTGTPLENHLGELWSLFNFLQPGYLGDEKQFRSIYRRPIENGTDTAATQKDALARRVRPFILRRTKEAVAAELPAKTEMIRSIDLGTAQRDLYETIRLSMHEKIRREIASKGLARSHIMVLDALLKMRQVCCDPRLLKMESAKKSRAGSAKLETLMEMLPGMIEDGRRILLFSQFAQMLGLIEDACLASQIPYVKITGSTKDRMTPIQTFQNGEVPLFLISLKAGGTGLNLTAADTVIHYDPWWNPAVERQATDRAHRIGQDKPVFVYKLLTTGTVEEKIQQLQERKQALADALFDPAQTSGGKLTEKDIAALFEPAG